MGIFDKLVNAVQEGNIDKALDSLKDIAEEAGEGVAKLGQAIKENIPEEKLQSIKEALEAEAKEAEEKAEASPTESTADEAPTADGPSGISWGPVMPEEENQYNYNGTYEEYFTEIFNTEFPNYTVTKESIRDGRALCYTFVKDGRTALIVEIMSRKSNAQKLRNTARREGIAYLRYYYDYHGWWNTKAYVIQRTGAALG